jgi:hypothetical protein
MKIKRAGDAFEGIWAVSNDGSVAEVRPSELGWVLRRPDCGARLGGLLGEGFLQTPCAPTSGWVSEEAPC